MLQTNSQNPKLQKYEFYNCNSIVVKQHLIAFFRGNREEESEDNSAEGGEEHLEILRQAEGERVGGNPEHRDGFLEDETPLHAPVHLADVAFHGNRLEQGRERAAVLADVHVGDFVDSHEDGRERSIHHHADAEGAEELQPRHRSGHGGGNAVEGHVAFHESRDAEAEDVHRQGNPHTQQPPDHKLRGKTKAFVVVFSRPDATTEHLAESGQNAEFEEGHPQREPLVSSTIGIVNRVK